MKSKMMMIVLSVCLLNVSTFASETTTLDKLVGTVKETSISYIEPNNKSLKYGYLFKNETFEILESAGDYWGVILPNESQISYVEKDKIELKEVVIEEEIVESKKKKSLEREETQVLPEKKPTKEEIEIGKRNALVDYAFQFIGNPYVYGGNSLTNGVDCSGFTQQVYKKFGIALNRTSGEQFLLNGKKVQKKNLQKGDLIFYGDNNIITHVAIYIGNDKVVHAANPKDDICIGDAWDYMPPVIGYKTLF